MTDILSLGDYRWVCAAPFSTSASANVTYYLLSCLWFCGFDFFPRHDRGPLGPEQPGDSATKVVHPFHWLRLRIPRHVCKSGSEENVVVKPSLNLVDHCATTFCSVTAVSTACCGALNGVCPAGGTQNYAHSQLHVCLYTEILQPASLAWCRVSADPHHGLSSASRPAVIVVGLQTFNSQLHSSLEVTILSPARSFHTTGPTERERDWFCVKLHLLLVSADNRCCHHHH